MEQCDTCNNILPEIAGIKNNIEKFSCACATMQGDITEIKITLAKMNILGELIKRAEERADKNSKKIEKLEETLMLVRENQQGLMVKSSVWGVAGTLFAFVALYILKVFA